MSEQLSLRCWLCVFNALKQGGKRVPFGPFFKSYETFGAHFTKNHASSYFPSTGIYMCPLTNEPFETPQDLHIHWEQSQKEGLVDKVIKRDQQLIAAEDKRNQRTKEQKAKAKKKAKKASKGKRKVSHKGTRLKGKNYENALCRQLSEYWCGTNPNAPMEEQKFRRTPYSGADNRYPLDIESPDDFPWLVEAKNREGLQGMEQMERYLKGIDYPPLSWLTVAESRLDDAGVRKPVLLITKKNHFDSLAFMRPVLHRKTKKLVLPMSADLKSKAMMSHELLVMPLQMLIATKMEEWIALYNNEDHMVMGYPDPYFVENNPYWRDDSTVGKWRK